MAIAASAWLANANPICQSCGREASTADAKVCGHCQTPYPNQPAKAEAPKATAVQQRELAGDGDAFEFVKAEIEAAKKHDARGKDGDERHPNVAFFHYRNALALAPRARISDASMREDLTASVRRSLDEVTHFSEACPACKGSRDFVQKAPDIGQNTGRIGTRDWLKKKVPCPLCGAKGYIPGFRNYASMTRFLADGRREFDTAHHAAGDTKVGYAWVPEPIFAEMDARERATVASGYGAPCPKCGWTGLEDCKTCKGEGVVKCSAVGCKNGFVESTAQSRLGGGSVGRGRGGRSSRQDQQKEVKPCETCGGTALVVCDTCAGARLQPCRKCGGEGLAPLCKRCNGTGLMTCRKCSGNGRTRKPGRNGEDEECPECKGLGEVSCQGCSGLGRSGRL